MQPPDYHPSVKFRPARGFVVRLAVLIFLIIAAFQSISFYFASLWYGSLGFESVYWYRLRAEAILFLSVATVSAIVLWVIFRLVTPTPGHSPRPFLQFGQQAIVMPTTDTLKQLAMPVSIVVGAFFGIAFSSDWNTFALFLNRTATPTIVDPIFGRPISFYLRLHGINIVYQVWKTVDATKEDRGGKQDNDKRAPIFHFRIQSRRIIKPQS
jgi:uncharacterized membrane protein (UPF0182 family)